MSAYYDFFPTPQADGSGEGVFHARLVIAGRITTDKMIQRIADRCSLTPGDISAALLELSRSIEEEIRVGNSIQLKGIGTFRGSAKSPAVGFPGKIRAENIRFGGIVFTPDKALEDKLKGMTFKRVSETRRSAVLDDGEIDAKLAVYFLHHEYITTQEMCAICGLCRSTALRRLKERVKDGRLMHPGYRRAPFYYPSGEFYPQKGNCGTVVPE